jgi:hypothetical protein
LLKFHPLEVGHVGKVRLFENGVALKESTAKVDGMFKYMPRKVDGSDFCPTKQRGLLGGLAVWQASQDILFGQ